jgi:hypothetical protein
MKKTLMILAILAISISGYALEKQKIYFLSMEYDNGSLKLLDIRPTIGFPSTDGSKTLSYRAELVSKENITLYRGYFEIPNIIHTPPPLGQEIGPEYIYLEKVNFSISLPYDKNAVELNIYDKENRKLLSINLTSYEDLCGDGICSPTENTDTCPKDCASEGNGNTPIFYLIAAALTILLITAMLRKKKTTTKKPRISR